MTSSCFKSGSVEESAEGASTVSFRINFKAFSSGTNAQRTVGCKRTFMETFHRGSRRKTARASYIDSLLRDQMSSRILSSDVVRWDRSLIWPGIPSPNDFSPRLTYNLAPLSSISMSSSSSPVRSGCEKPRQECSIFRFHFRVSKSGIWKLILTCMLCGRKRGVNFALFEHVAHRFALVRRQIRGWKTPDGTTRSDSKTLTSASYGREGRCWPSECGKTTRGTSLK